LRRVSSEGVTRDSIMTSEHMADAPFHVYDLTDNDASLLLYTPISTQLHWSLASPWISRLLLLKYGVNSGVLKNVSNPINDAIF